MNIWLAYTDENETVIMEVYGLIEPIYYPFPYHGSLTEADPRYKTWYDIQKAMGTILGSLPEPVTTAI